jgi:hypothetical protein
VKAALQMRLNKTDENAAEGLAQVDAHRMRIDRSDDPAFQFDTRRAERLACSLAPAGVSASIAGSRR